MISKNQIKFVKQLEMKKYRQREGLFVAEGPKVVGDLLAAGFEPHAIYATEEWILRDYGTNGTNETNETNVTNETNGTNEANEVKPFTLVSPDELRKLSFLQHPQQVLAVFRLPSLFTRHPLPIASHSSPSTPHLPRLELALDGIQDPGNLGTIIRIADWFGIGRIFCSQDTADAWSPKVVQATMGSIARVGIIYTDLKEYLNHSTLPICGTLLDGDDIYSQELPQEAIIVMGNEGNGISDDIRQLIPHHLLIPPYRLGAESLNVAIATAITCSEFRRRGTTLPDTNAHY